MMWRRDLIVRAEIVRGMIRMHGVKFFGAVQYLDADGDEYDKMVYYVLRSCSEVLPYIKYVISCALLSISFGLGRNPVF